FQLGPTNVGGGVNDLALQVGEINYIEINDPERADTCCSEIQRERRAQSASADAQHARGFQLRLSVHAHLGHDQVARVAQDFVVRKSLLGFSKGSSHTLRIADCRAQIAYLEKHSAFGTEQSEQQWCD